jgi:hypothetical protein
MIEPVARRRIWRRVFFEGAGRVVFVLLVVGAVLTAVLTLISPSYLHSIVK